MKEPKALKELHEIMEIIYEEEKDLSIEERLTKIKNESDKFMLSRGLKLRRAKSKERKYSLT